MAILYECPGCHEMVSGSASSYGEMCDECSGVNAAKKEKQSQWAAMTLEQKVEELKRRLDANDNKIDWISTPIG